MRSKQLSIAAILGFAVLAATAGTAQAVSWTGSGSGDWNSGGNWLGFFQPGAADSAVFEVGSPFVIRTGINVSANTTAGSMFVAGNHFSLGGYSFTRSNSAVLTINGLTKMGELGSAPSTTTFNGFRLDTGFLTFSGQSTTNLTGSAVITSAGVTELFDSSRLNVTSGTLNAAGGINVNDSGRIVVESGGTLNMTTGTTMNLNGSTSQLQLNTGFAFSPGTTINTSPGADIVGTSYIDIGNGGANTVNLNGSGTTLTAAGNTVSDWGLTTSGSATVNLTNSAVASVQRLNIANGSGNASINVNSGSQLNIGQTLTMGGGASGRFIGMSIDGGTVDVTGAATYNAFADTNLISGTLRFRAGATINANARLDITGGTLDTTNQTLTINGGTLTQSISGALSSGSALRVQAGGTATFSNFFDIGNGNSAALTVTGAGSTLTASGATDWGAGSSGGAIVNIDSGGVANLNGLSIGNNNGSATVTVATGGQLKPNVLTVGGGSTARTVNLTINGGTVTTLDPNASNTFNDKAVLNLQAGTFDPKGQATFFTGSTANWSGGSFLVGSGKTLTLQGGVINRTITTPGGLSPGATLVINSAGRFESAGSYSIGEFGAGTATVTGTGSRLNTTGNLTLGQPAGGSTGSLTIGADGRLNVGDTATTNNVGTFSFIEDASVNPTDGGILTVFAGSTLTNTANSGLSIGRGVGRRGSVLVSGAGATVNDNATFLGFQGAGTLTINAGGKYIANSADFATSGGTATVAVDGAGSLLWSKGNLNLGSSTFGGRGDIDLTSGGDLRVGDATNDDPIYDVYISDADPIGTAGGVLTIANGSTLESAQSASLGTFSGQSGRVVVTGLNSRWTSGNSILLGYGPGSQGELLLQSGGLATAPNLFVGQEGMGTLSVATGARAESTFQVVVAALPLSSGTATVTGTNSTLAVGTMLEVGRNGTGTLNINNGGVVTSSNTLAGAGTGGSGTITIDGAGSSLRASNNLTLDRGSTITTTTGGTVLVGDNALGLGNDRLAVGDSNAIGSGQGGVLTITGGSVLNHHFRVVVSPFDNTFGEIRVNGANSQLLVGELLIIGNGSTNCTALITIEAGGKVKTDTFQGSSLTSKIIINAGGTFEANSSMLNRTRDSLASGYNGGNWLGASGITSVTAQSDSRLGIGYKVDGALLTAKLTLKGDTDLTGTVDFDDLLVLAQNYNLTGKFWQDGDFTYDGNITFDDLLALAQNYGIALSVDESSTLVGLAGGSFAADWAMAQSMVPEPSTAALLLTSPLIRRRRTATNGNPTGKSTK